MPNKTTSIWSKRPDIEEYATKRKREGVGPSEIRAEIKATFNVDLTERQVRDKLRDVKPEMSEGVPELLLPKGGFAQDVRRTRAKHPEGWEPHVEIAGDKAVGITQPMDEAHPDETKIIEGFDLDPKVWMISGPINCRKWQSDIPVEENSTDCRCDTKQSVRHYESRWKFYYKVNLVPRVSIDRVDVDELSRVILKHKAPRTKTETGPVAFAVAIADPQLGKHDGGGVKGTTERWLDSIGRVQDRARDLRKSGTALGPLYVFGMGDIIEDCADRYAMQAFTVELNLRDQAKLARRLIAQSIREWAPLFERVVVACVGGNHGENRRDGKAFTNFADNLDVGVFEAVEEAFSENQDAFGHVSFKIPNDRLDMTLDVAGTITGLAHGHQAGRGATPAQKLDNWWKDQAHGMQPIGDAQLLLSGHYHHLSITQSGVKTHIQCPALEGGSDWWRNQTGQSSPPGLLTLTIGSEHQRNGANVGWGNLQVV